MLYSSKTCLLKKSDISRIARTCMQIVQWMYHVNLRDRKSLEELQNSLGIANIMNDLHQIERMDKENPANNCRFIVVDSQRGKCRPCKTSTWLINDDLTKFRLLLRLAQNCLAWKKTIRNILSNPC